MEGDPDPHSQPSRKRSRHDDPPFHLPPTPESVPPLPPSSRFRDHHSSRLMSPQTPNTTAAALADAAANAAAAAAAAAAVTSTPLSSTAPVLQTMHPPIPNFAAIAHATSSRHQGVIPHSSNLTDRHHSNTPIYNIALPLPNPGRAHRFCQACDHVNHVRRKLCTNCGAPKPSAVRNAVGVRPVVDPASSHDQHRISDAVPSHIPAQYTRPGHTNLTYQNYATTMSSPNTPTPNIYNRPRHRFNDDAPTPPKITPANPSSSAYDNTFTTPDLTNHQAHPLTISRPGDDIPLPPSSSRVQHSLDPVSSRHPHRSSHTVLADPLVNPSQMPTQLPSSSVMFPQKSFSYDRNISHYNRSPTPNHHNIMPHGRSLGNPIPHTIPSITTSPSRSLYIRDQASSSRPSDTLPYNLSGQLDNMYTYSSAGMPTIPRFLDGPSRAQHLYGSVSYESDHPTNTYSTSLRHPFSPNPLPSNQQNDAQPVAGNTLPPPSYLDGRVSMTGNFYGPHTQLRQSGATGATADLSYGLTNDNRERYMDQSPEKGTAPSSALNSFSLVDRTINDPRLAQSPVATGSPAGPAATDDGRTYHGDGNSPDDIGLQNKDEGRINFTAQGRGDIGGNSVDDDGRADEGRFAIGNILMQDKNGGTIRRSG